MESDQSAYEQDSNGGNQTESWVDDDEEEHAAPQPEVEDLDKIAEYIVSVGAEWDELKRKDKWEPFHLQVGLVCCNNGVRRLTCFPPVPTSYLARMGGTISYS